jgi:hypothetical protein
LELAADFEFHFSDTPERIKEAFFEAILPYNFFYFGIVIKAGLYGPGFKFRESFYKYVARLIFPNAKQHLADAVVVFYGTGTREFKRQPRSYLGPKVNEPGSATVRIRKVKLQDSRRNNLLQLADVICGAVSRSFKGKRRRGEIDFRRTIAHREVYVQVWPRENKNPEP